MRGKPPFIALVSSLARITPARAGKTMSRKEFAIHYQHHPRACGENYALQHFHPGVSGSPPRVRGKPLSSIAQDGIRRITPARAGKTLDSHGRRTENQDHPRACGENVEPTLAGVSSVGSPPRMRGKL